ncbi:MAG: hypothetical protein Wins2KO_03140 [Winogradskyella sp.]
MISKLHLKNENNLAGFILFLGTFCILITIGFEYTIGWIGVERSANAIPQFIYMVWDDLKHIWAWQIFGFSLQCIAYILLLKNTTLPFKSLLWATLMVLSLFIIIGFGICLGSYYPALEVYEQQPQLFEAIRGAVRFLYGRGGLLSFLILALIFFIELFASKGVIPKKWGIPTLLVIVTGILLSLVPSLPGKVIGATIFFIPLSIGFAYWMADTTLKTTTS